MNKWLPRWDENIHLGPCSNPECDNKIQWSGDWFEECDKCDPPTIVVPEEELRLIIDLAMVARKTDDGRVAPMIGGSARAMAARSATDKYDQLLRKRRSI